MFSTKIISNRSEQNPLIQTISKAERSPWDSSQWFVQELENRESKRIKERLGEECERTDERNLGRGA